MSLWTSAGSVVRAEGELGLLNQEQLRITRQSNMIAQARAKEKKGLVENADNLTIETDDKYHKTKSAEYAKEAANLGLIGTILSCTSALSIAGSACAQEGFNASTITNLVSTIVSSSLQIFSQFMNIVSIDAELETMKQQKGKLEGMQTSETKMVKALDQGGAGL